jgi:hypothetical protein
MNKVVFLGLSGDCSYNNPLGLSILKMPDSALTTFQPIRRRGLFLLGVIVFISFASGVVLFVLALQEEYGAYFVLFLIFSLLLLIPSFFAMYRFYALIRAEYRVSREGVLLVWGLRREEIPLNDIDWVRMAKETEIDLALPFLALPGAILGIVHNEELGTVEYLASDLSTLLLIYTSHKTYAISPSDAGRFLDSFRRSFEMGSLAPIQPTSVLPATYLRKVWSDQWARAFMLAGFLLTLLFLTAVSLIIPSLQTVSLGFTVAGIKLAPVQSTQLLLLPILGIFFFVADLIGGLFFYRKADTRSIAFILWIGSITTGILLFAALAFILF